jgi:hypothetical protein
MKIEAAGKVGVKFGAEGWDEKKKQVLRLR